MTCLVTAQGDEFDVQKVIHPVVAGLPAPKMIEGFGEGQMAITTSSDEAAKHFAQGLSKLNTAWDFEAYRHFCQVVTLDPECLMGYWGIALSLSGGNHEFFNERTASIERMLDLLESKDEKGEVRWNPMEAGFAAGIGFLLTDGPRKAGKEFERLVEKYPANIQASLLSLSMQRTGFDRGGRPRLGQRKAEAGFRKLLEKHPENISVMAFWIKVRSERLDDVASLREDVLPVAEKLITRYPDYAPFHLILAQAQSSCGYAKAGLQASERAKELFKAYMKNEGVALYDCDGLIRAQLFEATLKQLLGDMKGALEVCKELALFKIDETRVFSKGATLLLWEGRTLSARLVSASNDKALYLDGQKIMAFQQDDKDWFKEKSFAILYRDCLGVYLGVRGAIEDKKAEIAKTLYDQFLLKLRGFEQSRQLAMRTSSYGNWVRASRTIGMLVPELRGMLAELEDGAVKLSAGTWYRAARDSQRGREGSLLPPSMPYPMEWRLGNHYVGIDEVNEATSWYLKAIKIRPNHPLILKSLSEVAKKLGKTEEALALKKQIDAVTK